MPKFATHHRLALAVGLFAGVCLFIVTLIGTQSIGNAIMVGVIAFAAKVSGGHAPDIDLSQPAQTLTYASRPFKYFLWVIRAIIFGVLFVILAALQGMAIVDRVFASLLLIGGTIYLIKDLPDLFHRVMPSHRTLLHEVSFWLGTGVGLGYLSHYILSLVTGRSVFTVYVTTAISMSVLLGAIRHISSDRISTFVKTRISAPVRRRLRRISAGITPPVILDLPRLGRIALSSRAPTSIRALVVGIAAYGLMPVDIITDAFVGVGYVDDVSVYLFLRRIAHAGYQYDEVFLQATKREWRNLLRIVGLILLAIFLSMIAVIYLIGSNIF